MVNLLEEFRVSPATGGETNVSLALTFFDIHWLPFPPIRRLLFHEFPCSNAYFLETIVPSLKQSLSLTLRHYTPLAGNLLCPLGPGISNSRYVLGDSVSLAIAVSSTDFDKLTENFARDADEFHAFVPRLPPVKEEPEYKIIPVLALQITLFPNRGLCFGFTNHHAIGDASSIVGFIKAWASVSIFSGDSDLIESKSLPFYDRSVIRDPIGIDTIFWTQVKKFMVDSPSLALPTNKVRATYILQQVEIKKLKDFVLSKRPFLAHVSSFVATTAYVWTCLVKSGAATGEEVDDEEPEYFAFTVDCRTRLNPPIPANYFGNCLGIVLATSRHFELVENEGFANAAEVIGKAIQEKVHKEGEILKGAENWLVQFESLFGKRVFGVAGSPRFDLYSADFGWGRPKKIEAVSIDKDGSISLCKSREFNGGLEIGLSLPKQIMDAFAAVFANGLKVCNFSNFNQIPNAPYFCA
ncbi:Coumaroyl-CoA:anthocyanidin 3-O-glucoside-6''-O-coumaroyltransferase 2 [Abeliophyllum distichum]|uniref:Coumaroyl-CoA:anthocyanidin 3-O-glucoside-6''-O-coumaroyltransferase 2 n=1 Tax=Abeliophyllum distichum TaxID=126358 RepID=A0ABD1QM05_9LAMI